jgi:hypothetical protein
VDQLRRETEMEDNEKGTLGKITDAGKIGFMG